MKTKKIEVLAPAGNPAALKAAVFAGVLVLAKIVHREQAGVRAALAAHGLVRGSERFDLFKGKQRGFDLGGCGSRGRTTLRSFAAFAPSRGRRSRPSGTRFNLRGGGSRGRATLRSFAAFAPLAGVFRLVVAGF